MLHPGQAVRGAGHSGDMTTAAPSRETTENIIQVHRAEAAQHGSPLPRSAYRMLFGSPKALIYLSGGELRCEILGGIGLRGDHPLTVGRFSDLLRSAFVERRSILVSDEEVNTVLGKFLESEALTQRDVDQSDDARFVAYNTAARAHSLLSTMDSARTFNVLTRVLTHDYWLPEGMDETSLEDWAGAFGTEAGPGRAKELLALAYDTSRPKHTGQKGVVKALFAAESMTLSGQFSRSTNAHVNAFGALERHKTASEALDLMDPQMVPAMATTGVASRITSVTYDKTSNEIRVTLTRPSKLKSSKRVIMVGPDGYFGGTTLESATYLEGELTGHLAGKEETSEAIQGVLTRGGSVYLAEEPYLPVTGAQPDIPAVATWTVPVDTILDSRSIPAALAAVIDN